MPVYKLIFCCIIHPMEVKFTINGAGVLEKAFLTDETGAVVGHGVRGATVEDYDPSLITEAVIPDSVIAIGDGAFAGCDWLAGVTIPDSVTHIGDRAFYDCYSLKEISIPDGVTRIGNDVFADCNQLERVTLPGSLTSIGDRAFAWCESLTGMVIPKSVESVGDRAFYGVPSG